MPVYEFECPKGHLTEDLVPLGTRQWPCTACRLESEVTLKRSPLPLAQRVLSPTPTTFRFADR